MQTVYETGGVPEESIDSTNYAKSEEVVARCRRQVLETLDYVRDQRSQQEDIWSRNYKIWLGKHDIRLYKGHSDLFIPMTTKIIETFVSQVRGQLFPEAQTFLVEPSDEFSMAYKPAVELLVEHDIEQANLRQKLDQFVRLGLIYGPAVLKCRWMTRSMKVRRRRPTAVNLGRLLTKPTSEPSLVQNEDIVLYNGPSVEIVDPLRFFIHPITAKNIDDARLVFEDITVDWNHLVDMEKKGIYKDVDRVRKFASREGEDGQTSSERDNRVNFYGYSAEQMAAEDPPRWRLTEVWGKFDLYGDGRLVPCKIVAVGDIVLEIRANPLFMPRPPYFMWRVYELMDNVYGRGVVEQLAHMQYAFNALMNQAMDTGAMQINPPIGVNVNALEGELGDLTIAPLALLPTLDSPGEVFKFFRPPNTMETALNLAQVFQGLMQDMAGAPPILQGKVGNDDLTATEADILRSGAGAFTSAMASKIEADVLTPLLQWFYFLEQQFGPPERHMKITGGPSVQVNREDLVGDFTFKWWTGGGALQRQVVVQQRGGGMTAGPPSGGGAIQGVPGGESQV